MKSDLIIESGEEIMDINEKITAYSEIDELIEENRNLKNENRELKKINQFLREKNGDYRDHMCMRLAQLAMLSEMLNQLQEHSYDFDGKRGEEIILNTFKNEVRNLLDENEIDSCRKL